MLINGKQVALKEEKTLMDFLHEEGYSLSRIAVERNGRIVPKAEYGRVMLAKEDEIEIVSFVGGG